MNKLLTVLTILLIATVGYAQTYTVERVIDGNTIKLTNGEEVRLIGIKTPEDEKMGQEATKFVQNQIFYGLSGLEGAVVKLEFDVQERDKYGRKLAYVYMRTGKFCTSMGCKGDLYFADSESNKTVYEFYSLIYAIFKSETEYDGDVSITLLQEYIFINATIIKAGYAKPMTIPPNMKNAGLFKKLYKEAKEQKRGLWK